MHHRHSHRTNEQYSLLKRVENGGNLTLERITIKEEQRGDLCFENDIFFSE